MKRRKSRIIAWIAAAAMALSMTPTMAFGESSSTFAGGSGTESDPYVIKTAEQLAAVAGDLDAHYVLDSDIDLSSYGTWTPVGEFENTNGDGETPDQSKAFSGVFDGKGHKITGINVDGNMAAGLFGVTAGAEIKDLSLENVSVKGTCMVGAAVGYAFESSINNVDITGDNNKLEGNLSENDAFGPGSGVTAPNMIALVTGAGMDSEFNYCDVDGAKVVVETKSEASAYTENVHDVGILGGGFEGCRLYNCTVKNSSINVDNGPYVYGIGGLSGCAVSAPYVTGCKTENVSVSVNGQHAYLIGGMLGYTGTTGNADATNVNLCSAGGSVTVGSDAERIGKLIGGGYYIEGTKAFFPVPARYDISESSADVAVTGKSDAGMAGYSTELDTIDGVRGDVKVFAGGDGSASSPYIITTPEALYSVRYAPSADYKLGEDIDLDMFNADMGAYVYHGWLPIGTVDFSTGYDKPNMSKIFSGNFDGGGHTVSNIIVDVMPDSAGMMISGGLFGYTMDMTGSGANIHDLIVKDVSVNVDESMVTDDHGSMATGGVIGYAMNGGSVTNVTLTASEGKRNMISGSNCVGAIIGGSSSVNIANCRSEKTDINVLGNNKFDNGRIIQYDMAECGGGIVGGGFGGSIKSCTVNDVNINAEGNEPVGLGGLCGSGQLMTEISGNGVNAIINAPKGGHAIGGLCGYTGNGTQPTGDVNSDPAAPTSVTGNTVNASVSAPGATHVGGLVGTGMYYLGMEHRFNASGNTITGSVTAGTDENSVYGFSAPGAVAGRAVGCTIGENNTDGLTINGNKASAVTGTTSMMYESSDQYDDKDSGSLISAISEEYQQLFTGATFNSKYDHYWHDYSAAVIGTGKTFGQEDDSTDADILAAVMKQSIGGSEADFDAKKLKDQFFCDFRTVDGKKLDRLVFNGTQISGYDAGGSELFSHAYRYIGMSDIFMGEQPVMEDFTILKSLDENSGEYTYFFIAPDTPDETFHIEFRYGSSLDDLKKYAEGSYANWMAAGIPVSALSEKNEAAIEKVISLFCVENAVGNDFDGDGQPDARTASSLSQLGDLVGTWDCNVSNYPEAEEYGITGMYCVLDAEGHGKTFVRSKGSDRYVQSAEYDYYAYDNDSNGVSGVYVPYTEDETPVGGRYEIIGNTLKFTTLDDKTISYTKRSSGGGHSGVSHTGSGNSNTGNTNDQGQNGNNASNGGFTDVSTNAYYTDAVKWAVEKKITSGISATTFSPDASCTRAQIVTFLWRNAGSPAVTGSASKFIDVASDAYYADAVAWALEKGITSGTSMTTFSPDATCTRAQIVTFMWRSAGSPAASGTAQQFGDISANAYYAAAAAWAVEKGITSGTSETKFSPDSACTRAQSVTFIYRAYK